MKLIHVFKTIEKICQDNGFSTPWIVGGAPRDKVMGHLENLSDIDLTTGDQTIFSLAKESAMAFAPHLDFFKIMNDGHASMKLENIKIDFSSNFNIKNIESVLKNMNIKHNSLIKELYSRDFTCNTLLWSLDLKKILDLTGRAVKDIKNKKIKTCLSPDITLGQDPRRIIRSIYLAVKLNFELDSEIILWIKNNKNFISQVDSEYITKKINKSMKINYDKTKSLIKELDIYEYIPYSEGIIEYKDLDLI